MPNQNAKPSTEKHTNLTELEHLKVEHFDIYQELMKQFKFDDRVCHEWLMKPKRPLQGKSPFEQLSIDTDEVMDMLVRMKTGDFS
ncbi:antitoxin Xre/MbcA/ParS toxin-binding domain-containing protein [Thalassotalea sp. Y01]|uniref:antitoxin Xre/MbcA/ParS toxin-binding domain-containing protein n=1 Tax=Thalassotalea sp. Y01 TaxID=2729613 RepID=UPI001B7D6453|nr:antitoxin Xre/MbcA/ParS toxin-binding domain-containing protein [Thalassotalea sp. Y01]